MSAVPVPDDNPALRAALDYASRGWRVVPILRGQKRPPFDEWQRKATTDEATIQRWFKGAAHGVGIATGAESGIFALDIDVANGKHGDETLADLEATYERLPPTREHQTGSGGRHLFFKVPPGVDIRNDAGVRLGPGLDIRGEGGQVLAPPTIHPNGTPYAVELSSPDHVADPPGWLIALLTRDTEDKPRIDKPVYTGDPRPGDTFAASVTWPELLTRDGATFLGQRRDRSGTVYEMWARPGVDDHAGATLYYGGTDLLKVFTSSWPGLTQDATYTRFGFYAARWHGGDHSKAASALAQVDASEGLDELLLEPLPPDVQVEASSVQVGDEPPVRRINLTPASSIKPRPVRWLWNDRIPHECLTLLGGREGIGKSTLAYEIAAKVTRGELDGKYLGYPKAVIVAATEDSWEHTIVPRLMAHGANLHLVFRAEVVTFDGVLTGLVLPKDVLALEQSVADVDAGLVLLDPLLSRLDAKLDTHKDAEVRLALEPMVALADRAKVAVLGLIHVNKSMSSDPLTMLMGSRAFVAVARAVMFVMKDPEDEGTRLLGQPKNNLGKSNELPTLTFRIEGAHVADTEEGPITTGKVVWLGATERSLEDALESAGEGAEGRTATSEAVDWLKDYLNTKGGTCASADVKKAARAVGHSDRTLQRALARAKVSVTSHGMPRQTFWSLFIHSPIDDLTVAPQSRPSRNLGATGATGATGRDLHSYDSERKQPPPVAPVAPSAPYPPARVAPLDDDYEELF